MTKDDLLRLKEKIEKLSYEEKKLRDKYLKQIANGEIQGPQVGYPSIDKPWIKYYREEPVREIDPNQTIYSMVFDNKNMNAEAIGYLGTVWTYEKLKKETDKCADAYQKQGIKAGDTILVGVSNSPETIVTLLALNKLGAISKWFDLRASEHDIEKYLNLSDCEYMVAFDMLLPKIEKIINNTKLKKVIVTNPVNSTSNLVKTIFSLKSIFDGNYCKFPKDQRFIKYNDFIEFGDENSTIDCIEFDKERPSIMIQSSGTTGKPKTIVHSDYSVTQCTREIAYSDIPLGDNKQLLVALPPWIAYGIVDAMVLPLSLGTKIELCPNFEPDSVFKNVGKFTVAFAAPFHYRYLRDNMDKLSKKQKEQFKKVECLVSGGDKMTVEENLEFEKIFDTKLVNGYGNNESCGVLTVNPKDNNKYGTVGIPKYSEIIISYDSQTGKELSYGEVGEICSLANTHFLEYENNPVGTKECKILHDDNKVWLHTGDLGYIDREGYIHLSGRVRRVIIRLGFKISAYTIEDSISSNDFVKECAVVSVKDKEEEHVPMAYVVVKDEYEHNIEAMKKILFDKCFENLKEYEVPKYIQIVDKIPYTDNGKYDFVKLENIGNEFVEEQNNIKVNKKMK